MPDVCVVVHAFIAPTATGNFDITDTRLGGRTPKAVLFFVTNHVAANDGSGTVHAKQSVGGTDGTRTFGVGFRGQDGVSNSLTSRRELSSVAILVQDSTNSTTYNCIAAFNSWLTNGVRMNFTTADVAYRVTAVFFAGDDLQAYLGLQNLGTGTSAIDITAPNFEPDAVFGWTSHGADASNNEVFYGMCFGIAINDGVPTQYATSVIAPSAEAENMAQIIWDNRIGGQKATGGTSVTYTLTAGTFDSQGFSITPSASAGSDDWLYLALSFGGKQFDLFPITTPTSTGVQSYTAPGFEPQFGFTVCTFLQAYNTGYFDGDVGSLGFGMFDDTEQWSPSTWASWFSGATHTSEALCQLRDFGLTAYDPEARSTTTGVRALRDAFTASGFDLDYTIVDGTARKGFGFALEINDAPPSPTGGSRAINFFN